MYDLHDYEETSESITSLKDCVLGHSHDPERKSVIKILQNEQERLSLEVGFTSYYSQLKSVCIADTQKVQGSLFVAPIMLCVNFSLRKMLVLEKSLGPKNILNLKKIWVRKKI